MSIFCFIDEIVEVKKNESLSAFFTLKGDEEFLRDHFDGFPVMPGVLLLESLRQAASALVALSSDFEKPFCRLAKAEEVKFGRFVKPGSRLKLAVRLIKKENSVFFFEGRIDLMEEDGNHRRALSANFSLVPVECSATEAAALAVNSRLIHQAICVQE